MKINGYDFLIGADPEFFVAKQGVPVSAYGLVPGTKEAPFKVNKGAVQVDGMALEFNIDPADTHAMFEDNLSSVLDQIIKMVPGYEVYADPPRSEVIGPIMKPVAEFGLRYIQQQPDEAKELGCNPDYNAYTKKANPRPNAETPFRTASGHIHIGWTKDVDPNDDTHLEACFALVKHLDAWLGIPSVLWDSDNKRRELYGKAGAFRPKSYGLEYRVLSNAWVSSPFLRKVVYWNTIEAIKDCFKNPDRWDSEKLNEHSVREVLNQETPDWKKEISYAFSYSGIRSPSWYRENKV